jgi:dCMP deaminase
MNKWDTRFLELSRHVAGWSRDPSTRVGAVVVRPDKTIASVGFNGLPRGVIDSDERLHDRETKLAMTLHAEQNAILSAHERLDGCTIYVWPMPPCSHCAGAVIQAGISRVVAPMPGERWAQSCRLGRSMMWEAGVMSEWVTDKGELE